MNRKVRMLLLTVLGPALLTVAFSVTTFGGLYLLGQRFSELQIEVGSLVFFWRLAICSPSGGSGSTGTGRVRQRQVLSNRARTSALGEVPPPVVWGCERPVDG